MILTCGPLAFADEIVLKNGKVVEGNIIKQDSQNHKVSIDIVLSGELVGAIIDYNETEIQSVKRDGKYSSLKKNALSREKIKAEEQKALKRIKAQTAGINSRIRNRVSAEARQNQETEVHIEPPKQTELDSMYEPVTPASPSMTTKGY